MLVILFTYLFESQRDEVKTVGASEMFHLLVRSTNTHNSHVWDLPKSGARSSMMAPHLESRVLRLSSAVFAGDLAYSWTGNAAAKTQGRALNKGIAVTVSALSFCITKLPHNLLFYRK